MTSTVATPVSVSAPRAAAAATLWSEAVRLIPVLIQLGLAGLVIWQFHLETRSFFKIFALAVVAFPVHALLPLRYRLPFFTALSLAGIGVVFGMRDGSFLVMAGLTLILTCHLPVRFALRVVLLMLLASFFALARTDTIILPVSVAIWPILASMFMFRLALYMHALRHDPIPATPVRTLAYFFMLPNVCYPLFPVVDYSTFGRTHYDASPLIIYERGARWIIRGLIHLLLYRFVYLHLTKDPAQVASLGDLIQFMLSTFLLYLRVSGQFHLIIGMMQLFGFHLPETHRLYFLAFSFTDLWRRINIYWKDFMMKLVFYPSFFRLRRHGERFALVSATVIVFGATWMLHSYQWFWLRGSFPLTLQDALFWTILGALVIENSLRERRRSRQRTLHPTARRWNAAQALRTVGVFTTMCLIWSMWSSASVVEWLTLWSAVGNAGTGDLLLLMTLLTGGFLIAGRSWDAPISERAAGAVSTGIRPAARGVALLCGLLLIAQPPVSAQGGARFASVVQSLRSTSLNQTDTALQHKGYYEQLDDRGRLSAELWSVYGNTPPGWTAIRDTDVFEERSDFLLAQLRPDAHSVMVKGAPFSTNARGMRDRDYPTTKPAGTVRIALLGPSHTAGSGVPDGATFDALLETELNRAGTADLRYEVLNFSVPTYSFVQQVAYLETQVGAFEPDIVIVTATGSAYFDAPITRHLMTVLTRGIAIPYPELWQIIEAAGIRDDDVGEGGSSIPFEWLRLSLRRFGVPARMPQRELQQRLESVTDEVTAWALERAARLSNGMGAVPVLLALDLVGMKDDPAPVVAAAADAGFVVLDLLDVYDGHDAAALWLADWDNHPNAFANEIIAQRLYSELLQHATALRLRPARGD